MHLKQRNTPKTNSENQIFRVALESAVKTQSVNIIKTIEPFSRTLVIPRKKLKSTEKKDGSVNQNDSPKEEINNNLFRTQVLPKNANLYNSISVKKCPLKPQRNVSDDLRRSDGDSSIEGALKYRHSTVSQHVSEIRSNVFASLVKSQI